MEINVEIPQELSAITVRQYQEYHKVVEANSDAKDDENVIDFLNKKCIEIFCKVPFNDVEKLPFALFQDIIKNISDCFNEATPLRTNFTLTDRKGDYVSFGFEPKLDDIAYGAYQDAESYSDVENLHKLLAVLYRPIIHKKKDNYRIEEYEGSDKWSSAMLDAPLNVAFGMQVFFYRLGRKLSQYTMDYTLKEWEQKIEQGRSQLSEENGELISQYSRWHKMMLGELMRLQDYHYTSVCSTLNTRKR